MKRRTLLCMPFIGLFSSLAFSKDDVPEANLDNHTRAVFSDLSTIFKDRSSAAATGKKYLFLHPHLNNPKQLLSNLGTNDLLANDQALSLFERQRSEDYRLSNVVTLDGWVLSMAEVSLCCAISLLLTNS